MTEYQREEILCVVNGMWVRLKNSFESVDGYQDGIDTPFMTADTHLLTCIGLLMHCIESIMTVYDLRGQFRLVRKATCP